jgi:hypothetical protein
VTSGFGPRGCSQCAGAGARTGPCHECRV